MEGNWKAAFCYKVFFRCKLIRLNLAGNYSWLQNVGGASSKKNNNDIINFPCVFNWNVFQSLHWNQFFQLCTQQSCFICLIINVRTPQIFGESKFSKTRLFRLETFWYNLLIDLSGFFHSTQSLFVPKKHVWENGYAYRFKRSHT